MPFPTPSVPALPAAGIIFISYLSLFSRYNRYTGTANGDAVSAIRATGTNWLQIAVFGTALNFHYFLTPFAPRWCIFLRRTIPEPPQRAKPCRAKRRPASLAAVCLSRTRPFRWAGVEWGQARAPTSNSPRPFGRGLCVVNRRGWRPRGAAQVALRSPASLRAVGRPADRPAWRCVCVRAPCRARPPVRLAPAPQPACASRGRFLRLSTKAARCCRARSDRPAS